MMRRSALAERGTAVEGRAGVCGERARGLGVFADEELADGLVAAVVAIGEAARDLVEGAVEASAVTGGAAEHGARVWSSMRVKEAARLRRGAWVLSKCFTTVGRKASLLSPLSTATRRAGKPAAVAARVFCG